MSCRCVLYPLSRLLGDSRGCFVDFQKALWQKQNIGVEKSNVTILEKTPFPTCRSWGKGGQILRENLTYLYELNSSHAVFKIRISGFIKHYYGIRNRTWQRLCSQCDLWQHKNITIVMKAQFHLFTRWFWDLSIMNTKMHSSTYKLIQSIRIIIELRSNNCSLHSSGILVIEKLSQLFTSRLLSTSCL